MAILVSMSALVAACAGQYRVEPIQMVETAEQVTSCYIRSAGGNQIIGAVVKHIDGQWILAGRMRARGSSLVSPSGRTLRVEAVADNETVIYSHAGQAKPARATGRPRRSRLATFRLPIPDPASFHHLHLALVSPRDAEQDLSTHKP